MYARHTWTTWVLIPLWVLQMIFTVDALACLGFLILELQGEEAKPHVPAAWIAYMTLMFLILFVPPLETALWFARALHPWTFLGLQTVKTSFWALYLILAVATMATKPVLKYEELWALWKIWLMVGIALNLVCCVGALVYGAVVLRKWRRVERAYERLEEPAVKTAASGPSSSTEGLVP